MKKFIKLSIGILLSFFLCIQYIQANESYYPEHTGKSVTKEYITQHYPKLKKRIDNLFLTLQRKLHTQNDKTKIRIYNRIRENIQKYRYNYQMNNYQEDTYKKTLIVLDYIDEKAEFFIYEIQKGDVVDNIIEDIQDIVNNTDNTKEIPDIKVPIKVENIKVYPINPRSFSIIKNKNLLLGEFRVLGNKKNVKLAIRIQSKANNPVQLTRPITLRKDGKIIPISFINIKNPNEVLLQVPHLSSGIYSLEGSIKGLKNNDTITVSMQYSPHKEGIQLNSFIQKNFLSLTKRNKIYVNSYILGNDGKAEIEEAEITWIEYGDLECPFCRKLNNEGVVEEILDMYDGKVNFIFKQFPLKFHDNAQKKAESALCVGEIGDTQDYYKYISILLHRGSSVTIDELDTIVEEMGLDTEEFQNCFLNGKYTEKVKSEIKEGHTIFNITGTPGNVLINNTTGEWDTLQGAYPVKSFKQKIDNLLQK